jgi:hypothetical protein
MLMNAPLQAAIKNPNLSVNKLRVKDWEFYQHYKKKNKNYNNEQKWFMFYGRQLLRDKKFMSLTPVQRDFLVIGCWAVGSQDNGFIPDPAELAFWIRRDINEVNELLDYLLEEGWLELWSEIKYSEIQQKQEEIIHENHLELMQEKILGQSHDR